VTEELRSRLHPWDTDGCFALDYMRQEDPMEARRRFVWAVKNAEDKAIGAASRLLASSLSIREGALGIGARRPILVAAPRHLPSATLTPPGRLCLGVARLLPWLEHRSTALVRTQPIRRSSSASVRPTESDHLHTLACVAPFSGAHVILVDDVFTLGQTTDACRTLLLDAGARSVVIAALARTRLT
jgi:hypothetical protein